MEATELVTWIRSCCGTFLNDETWQSIKAFANSNFFTALVASGAGAFAGAYSAQRVIERNKTRDDLLKEIRNTNAAIMLSFNICNSVLALKGQHIQSMKKAFDSSRAGLIKHLQAQQAGESQHNSVFEFTADLQSFPRSQLPTETLQREIFEKLSIVGRPLSVVITLTDTATVLTGAIDKRNRLIEEYKSASMELNPRFPFLYYGLADHEGHVNEDYPSTIDAIARYSDDTIFFSHLLCRDLSQHGKGLEARFKEKFGEGAPHIAQADFAKARAAQLLPSEEDYADWLNAFTKKE